MIFEPEHMFYAAMSVMISIVVLLGHISIGYGDIMDNGKINIKAFAVTSLLYILSGLTGFIVAFNAFNSPEMQQYIHYRDIVAMVFGGFGTLTIPALHKIIELFLGKLVREVGAWAENDNASIWTLIMLVVGSGAAVFMAEHID